MSGVPQWVEYVVIVAIVLPVLIARQLRERQLTARLFVLPAVFLVIGFLGDHHLFHRLASVQALAMLAAGLVLAALTGAARAATMRVRRVGGAVVAKGNGWTLALWFVTIAVRIGEGVLAYALGVPEGLGEAMLFAATTFGVQGIVLARRGGLLTMGRPIAEHVG